MNSEEEDYRLAELSVQIEGKRKTGFTLIHTTDQTVDIPPSKRYLKILISAAKEKSIYRPPISQT